MDLCQHRDARFGFGWRCRLSDRPSLVRCPRKATRRALRLWREIRGVCELLQRIRCLDRVLFRGDAVSVQGHYDRQWRDPAQYRRFRSRQHRSPRTEVLSR